MRRGMLIATVTATVAIVPQFASAAPVSNGAAMKPETSLAQAAQYYRRDYDYYPRHRYYGYSHYPRHRYYRSYDYDGYYPRRRYYQHHYYRPYHQQYYRRYWY